ncbi:helix-turn-helix domain-containing protein [Actinomyces bouchesdurhonensis]|uniref:helix-turn-helix domain-containing protein n=1 Tax=Actinomyces bouchesdurhonensis TaxID=1852361 RepID=UPI0036F27834
MKSRPMQPDELLKTGEVAQRYSVAASTVRRWVAAGRLPATQLPSGQLRFSARAVEAAMRELNAESTGEPRSRSLLDVPLPGLGRGVR